MVAYSFKPSFLAPIRALEKQQTIRLPRKRHARPGEALQFFTGQRMRPVRIGGAVCARVCEVRLDFEAGSVTLDDAVVIQGAEALDSFAVRDGFNAARWPNLGFGSWEYMARWWALTHPEKRVFRGVLIDWSDSFKAAS